jgi:hypothetical protein
MVPGPTGMTPVGVPLDAQGRPVTTGTPQERAAAQRLQSLREQQTEAARQQALTNVATSAEGRAANDLMEQGRLRNDREMYNRGLAQFRALADAANASLVQEGLQPALAENGVPAAPAAPSVGLSQPIPTMLGGATGIAPAGFTPPMGGGTLMPGALSPAPMSAQPQGLLAQRPAAPAATAGGARTDTVVADATKLPPRYGVFDRAEVARQRETLNSQMQFIEAELRYAIATRASTETVSQLNSARVAAQNKSDMLSGMEAVSSLDAGDPRPIAEYFYRRTGGRLRMQQNADNSFNILDGDQITQRNMSKDELARYARSDVDYRVRAAAEEQKRVQAERAKEFYKTQLDIFKEVSQQEAIGTRDQALEKVKAAIKARTGQDPKMEIQDGKVYIFDPNNKRVVVGQLTNLGYDNKTKMPGGQTRLVLEPSAYGTVPTQ